MLDGELYVTGRRKDLIIIRGRNYYPADIEQSVESRREAAEQGRYMGWLRIERYLGDEPGGALDVRLLPMLCQQCTAAPCEPVCPVYASYHTPEGLNAQIYNRCVGTRYCSNNCPYKVRRFNWFNNHKHPSAVEMMVYNPEVTLRSPVKPDIYTNTYNFAHANGQIKPTVVKAFK